jgi:hypothetical protein
MTTSSSDALSKILGNIAMEVFQRRKRNLNKPLNQSSHNIETQGLSDDIKAILITATFNSIWGPGGPSSEVNSTTGRSARWDGGNNWS